MFDLNLYSSVAFLHIRVSCTTPLEQEIPSPNGREMTNREQLNLQY